MEYQHGQDRQLTARQFAGLEKVADDAVQRAASAVVQLLGITLQISAVKARGVPAGRIADLTGDPEELMAAIYLKVDGDAPGHAAFLCSEEQARRLVDTLLSVPPGSTQCLDELGESALQEFGNILTSSYLNSLSEHTGLTLLPRPPQIAVDMAQAIVSDILVGTVQASSEAISIITEFGHGVGLLQGFFVYIPEHGSARLLARKSREAA